jgi:hypothetical protein
MFLMRKERTVDYEITAGITMVLTTSITICMIVAVAVPVLLVILLVTVLVIMVLIMVLVVVLTMCVAVGAVNRTTATIAGDDDPPPRHRVLAPRVPPPRPQIRLRDLRRSTKVSSA